MGTRFYSGNLHCCNMFLGKKRSNKLEMRLFAKKIHCSVCRFCMSELSGVCDTGLECVMTPERRKKTRCDCESATHTVSELVHKTADDVTSN